MMRSAVRDAATLCLRLGLPSKSAAECADFPVFVPDPYLQLIRPGDPDDPLLLQVLPHTSERQEVEGFEDDPVGDRRAETSAGLIHKYRGRALMVLTGACAVHCRYCFRRHYDYPNLPHGIQQWLPALDALAADRSIEEVILSGGDPLTLADRSLAQFVAHLNRIDHVTRLRVHTRVPTMIPQRVTPALLDLLDGDRLQTWVVVHVNHPRELSVEVNEALVKLRQRGIPLLNQSVLLKRVNDDADVLIDLSRRLVEIGVTPYYLNQLDRVRGAAHFEVPIELGKQLIGEMRRRLPGYAVPRYVQDTGDPDGKQVLA